MSTEERAGERRFPFTSLRGERESEPKKVELLLGFIAIQNLIDINMVRDEVADDGNFLRVRRARLDNQVVDARGDFVTVIPRAGRETEAFDGAQ